MFTDIQPFRVNAPLGYQTMNRVRDNIFTLAAARYQHFLGGSRLTAMPRTLLSDVIDYVDVEIDSALLTGLSCVLRVDCRTSSAPGTVSPVLRNLTDGIDVAVGAAASGHLDDYSGPGQIQSIPVTLSPGLKKYRLRAAQSAGTFDTWMIGYLELFFPSTTVTVGSTLFTYAAAIVAPPLNNTLRLNAASPYTAVTKIWASNTSGSGANVHAQLMVITPGAAIYLEDKDEHGKWARFETLGVPIDQGTYVELPVKWVANGSPFSDGQEITFFAPSAGGLAAPHRVTHETGGVDEITKLDAAVLQSGTLLDTRLSANVALLTRPNHWTGWQYLDGQSLIYNDVSAAVGKQSMRMHHAGGFLNVESMNEVTGAPVGLPPLRVRHGGGVLISDLELTGALTAAGGLDVMGGTGTDYANAPIEIRMSSNPRIGFHWPGVVAAQIGMDSTGVIRTFDNPGTGYAPFVCGALTGTNIYTTSTSNSLGDLTCRGGTNFQNGVYVSAGDLRVVTGTIGADTNTWRSNLHTTGSIYPGTGAAQSTWYLAGNGSYGLYSNTGLYIESNLWANAGLFRAQVSCSYIEAAAHIRAAGGLYDFARGLPIGDWQSNAGYVAPAQYQGGEYRWTLVGHTLFLWIYANLWTGGQPATITMSLPGTSAVTATAICGTYVAGSWGPGHAAFTAGAASIVFSRWGANFQGNHWIALNCHIQIN